MGSRSSSRSPCRSNQAAAPRSRSVTCPDGRSKWEVSRYSTPGPYFRDPEGADLSYDAGTSDPTRTRLVGALPQIPRQFPDPALHPVRPDVRDRHSIHSSRSAVAPDHPPCRRQEILPPYLVDKGVEAPIRFFLRFRIVARSGVSERSPTLLDSRQWSCPCLLSVPLPTQGPFPRRALPPRPRYYGPIRHPAGPACPSRGSGCRRARHRQGFPCCYAFHLPCMPTPLPRRKPAGCPVALFPASRRPSPCHRRIGFRITPFRGLLGVHFTFRPAWSLNRLPT